MDYSQHYPITYMGFDQAFDPAGLYRGDLNTPDAVQDFREPHHNLGSSLFTGTLDPDNKAAYPIPWIVSPPEIYHRTPMLQPVALRRQLSHMFHSQSAHWQSVDADKLSDLRPKRPLPIPRSFPPPDAQHMETYQHTPSESQYPLARPPSPSVQNTNHSSKQQTSAPLARRPPRYLFCHIAAPHTHPWPDSGDFFIESCERICRLCERFNSVSPLFCEARTLRGHVSRLHWRNGGMRSRTVPKMMRYPELAREIRLAAVFTSVPKSSEHPTAATEESESALDVPTMPSPEKLHRPSSPNPLDLTDMDLIRYYNPGATISNEDSEAMVRGLSILDTSSSTSAVSIVSENDHTSTNSATPSNSTTPLENASPSLSAYRPDPVSHSQTLLTLALLFQQILPRQSPVRTAEEWGQQFRGNVSFFRGSRLDGWMEDIAPELSEIRVEPVG